MEYHNSIQILESNSNFVVCVKPVGISSESPGMPELLKSQIGGNFFPVHRLDQTIGGVMIYARTEKAAALFTKIFTKGKIEKHYLAVVSGCPPESSGIMIDYLYHDKRNNKTFIVKKDRAGVKKAELEYQTLQTVPDGELQFSLLSISLHTGRSHQIRVQLASRKLPLTGDGKYGSRIKCPHIALICQSLQFTDPYRHKSCKYTISAPEEYPWTLFSTANI